MNNAEIAYTAAGPEGLEHIRTLWEELNEYHRLRSVHFADVFANSTFDQRRDGLLAKAGQGHLRVDLAVSAEGERIGYCVSSIVGDTGEVESLYIVADWRRRGVGDTLMRRALSWMDERRVPKRTVVVGAGNEGAFTFYARYGFYPGATILRQRSSQ